MKASARKTFPKKHTRSGSISNLKSDKMKTVDKDTTSSESDGIEAPNPVLEAEGEALVGENAIGTIQSSARSQTVPVPDRNHRRHRKRVPKNHPFDASLVLNASPPYALGETLIDSIHLYQMGKKDETGAYVMLEEIKLFD